MYIDEYEKIFRYRDNILSKDVYINGTIRTSSNKIEKYYNAFFDLIKYKKNGNLND